jgi:uncharacterized membrane protein (GlpM family)
MDYKLLPLYFVLGGTIVTLVTYLGSQGKGLLAAFVALFPALTVVTLSAIYLRSGVGPTVDYAKGLLFMVPAWLIYVAAVIFFVPRLGLAPALAIGIPLYAAASYVTIRLTW